tara:strand:- start:8686 stop:9621 length:936 start_codon:yes stop_codon:yes gene_type:complete
MTDFLWKNDTEPHSLKRTELFRSHPEVKKLIGPEYKSKYISFILVISQLSLAVLTKNLTGWKYWAILYIFGGTITQALFLSVHEISHNLFFKKTLHNRLFGMFCNLPIVFPFSESFRFYHLQHHSHMGGDNIDSDIPCALETKIFRGKLGKFVWYNFQILFYALRPVLTKSQPITRYLIINFIIQIVFDTFLYHLVGIKPFQFLLLSLLIAGGFGLHPLSSHFVSEHYIFDKDGQFETGDYHGWLNCFTWNVGYHNAHHNMPNVPWSNLPHLTKLSCEDDKILVHKSWILLPIKFILDDNISLCSRIKRKT